MSDPEKILCEDCARLLPQTEEFFFRSARNATTWESSCKECRAAGQQARREEKRRALAALAREKAKMTVLCEAIKAPGAPHTAELVERLVAQFGGLDGLVNEIHSHYLIAKPGGPGRTSILQTIVRLITTNTQLGGAKKPLDYYTDEELKQEANARFKQAALSIAYNEPDEEPELFDDTKDSADHVEVQERA